MCLQFLRIWGWTIAKAAEKKIYYNLWIVQPITLYVFESRNKIFQSHHHKKVSCKTFYLFLSSTMCYSLRRTWRHLQVGAMVDGTVLDSCEEAGRWGVKRLEGAARSNRHSTPIHVTVLCHFLDLLQGVTFLSFWLAYQTLKSLIMILSSPAMISDSSSVLMVTTSSHLTTLAGLATATLLLMKFWWYQDFLRNSWHVSSYQSFILAQVT